MNNLLVQRPLRLYAVLAGLLLCGAASAVQAGPQVKIDSGWVEGAVVNNARLFRNIPFAEPPLGALRWKAPQPAAPWGGVLQAVGAGKICVQGGSEVSPSLGEEDCLVLHVTSPTNATASSKLPVMVWIHGGGFQVGSARNYDATEYANQHNVVVVSTNYRMGAMGFLALDGLRSEAADQSTGNYGLQDQIAALQWVKRNVAAFGGNPGNVTIAGESAGAISVMSLLTSPKAAGLFHRAIAQSVLALGEQGEGSVHSMSTSLSKGGDFAAQNGCPSGPTQVACMRGKSGAEIGQNSQFAFSALQRAIETDLPWAPTVDGVVLGDFPRKLIRQGNFHRVPVLIGSNQGEVKGPIGITEFVNNQRLTSDQYNTILQSLAPSVTWVGMRATYPVIGYGSPALAANALLTDATFACATQSLRQDLMRYTQVYGYEFIDPNSEPALGPASVAISNDTRGSSHADELAYLFNRQSPIGYYLTNMSVKQLELSGRMTAYWANFIRGGNPNGSGLPNWKAFSNGVLGLEREGVMMLEPGKAKMVYSSVLLSDFNDDHKCLFWGPILPLAGIFM
ncbi:carboxylesterase family protein [Pseudomonas sp. LS44]|uniref:carboxylesterase/lipase family protein n=1 Tax=Pseudomonas sp. LS44 TaxID=1357074 RepID=UPI00215AFC67|nr:carboxylesterase family protein [Pseudomonas sp. LS44]UVE17214.1 carboxylesterase family protein [Pseudomonas sp. LS44]